LLLLFHDAWSRFSFATLGLAAHHRRWCHFNLSLKLGGCASSIPPLVRGILGTVAKVVGETLSLCLEEQKLFGSLSHSLGLPLWAFVSLGILACNFSALWAFTVLASIYFLDFGSASPPASRGRLLLYYGHVIGIGVGLF
jgi:hypothetical protein